MTTVDRFAVEPPVGDTWERAIAEPNWLAYRLVPQADRKPKKIPQTPAGKNAGAKDAATLTFDKAQQLAAKLGPECGVGYLPRAGSAMVCIDFDGVLKDGAVVQAELPSFASYAERSPSGTGLHVLVARPAAVSPTTFDDGDDWAGFIGSDSKFFTVSMDRWSSNAEITEDRALVDWVFERRAQREPGQANTEKKAPMPVEGLESLKKLQQADLKSFWFHRLTPAARAKCATEMLAALPSSYARNYDTWLKAGMALKLADENLELFEVWDAWSATAPNYDGRTEDKWRSFSDHVNGDRLNATIRTVIAWSKQHGWDPAPWEQAADTWQAQRQADVFAKLSSRALLASDPLSDLGKREIESGESAECAVTKCPEYLTRPGGLVGALTDFGAARSPRETRLPALAGALAATSALTERHYIIDTPGFLTSPGLQVVLVSETGTGKETARDVTYAVCGLQSRIALADSYASAPALHLALTKSPTQLWANDEFGRYLKLASNPNGGGAHDFALITMVMKLHTMFEKFLPKKVYSQGADRDRVDHPLIVAMHTTTPKALFDAMDAATVVDGMLGRLLVIQQEGRPALKPLGDKSSDPLSAEVKEKIDHLGHQIQGFGLAHLRPPADLTIGMDQSHKAPGRWLPGQQHHRFIPICPARDALAHFEVIRQECENRAGAMGVTAALWSRAYEQILRVAGVVAFGRAVWDGNVDAPTISVQDLIWARDLVHWSLKTLVPAAEEHASDGERDKLQKSISANLKKLGANAPSGWVSKQTLLQTLKGRGRSYRDLKEEITALIECGEIETQIGDDGAPTRPEKLRCVE
jgi:hypothetical protein